MRSIVEGNSQVIESQVSLIEQLQNEHAESLDLIMQKEMIRKISIHLIFWIGYGLILYYLPISRIEQEQALVRTIILLLPHIGTAYLGMEVLVPQFLIKRNYFLFFISCMLLLVAMYYFHYYLRHLDLFQPPNIEVMRRHTEGGRWHRRRWNPMRGFPIIHSVFCAITLSVSMAYKMSLMAIRREKETQELRSENLQSQLKFLKSQINPHFLFNALNNIYALSITKSDRAPAAILKLSDILRYIIYEGKEDRVPLKQEIDYIENYIELVKLKDESIQDIKFDYNKANLSLTIEPMLFIPFIENSIKHSGIESSPDGFIQVVLETTDESINFDVINSMPKTPIKKDKIGGIGIKNIKKRLELLYPNKYSLSIENEKNEFVVKLNIKL